MLSDDVYRTRFRATVAELERWLAELDAVASVETASDAASWRASVLPNVHEACPFELMLRMDQKYDIGLGREVYEDLAVESLDRFGPMLLAIANGQVLTSTWSAASTGAAVRISTIISASSATVWSRTRQIRKFNADDDSLIRRDRHYVPYARGA